MTGKDIRAAFVQFFTDPKQNHVEIPAARIIPENDPSTLFTSSGMQQLVPSLKGEAHSMGTRLVNSQPSFRAEDIDEVGDNRHTTLFEMLGNWSLGDYFKEDQLPWFFEFMTKVVGLDPNKLYVTVFAGNNAVPRDKESIEIWQKIFNTTAPAQEGLLGFSESIKIYQYESNWWSRAGGPDSMPVGEIGGPDSEMFYDFGSELNVHQKSIWKDKPCHLNCDCGRFLEIGNSVFMQYIKTDTGFKPLPKQNVDFGGGLERIAAAANQDPDIFKTDLFQPIIEVLEKYSGKKYQDEIKSMRIIADHLRGSAFMVGQGVTPSNKAQGYFLRRILRRAALKAKQLKLTASTSEVFQEITWLIITKIFGENYFPNVDPKEIEIVIREEVNKFDQALNRGLKQFERLSTITGKDAFNLLQSFGFPLEITIELAEEKGIKIDRKSFEAEFKKHQDISRAGSQALFKGGLADHSDTIVRYHTTTHLLHAALRTVLGSHVQQMGSNITAERLRFDFKHNQKVTPEQIHAIEALINQKIKEDLLVHKTIEDKDSALKSGAMAFFRDKYPEKVSVYTIGKDLNKSWFSKELCGGPHVDSTGVIGPVTIKKEEAVGAGVRRMYITLLQNI